MQKYFILVVASLSRTAFRDYMEQAINYAALR